MGEKVGFIVGENDQMVGEVVEVDESSARCWFGSYAVKIEVRVEVKGGVVGLDA